MSAAAAAVPVDTATLLLCEACCDHFRGASNKPDSWPVSLLPCQHNICAACASAMALAVTEPGELQTCVVCQHKVTDQVQDRALAALAEMTWATLPVEAVADDDVDVDVEDVEDVDVTTAASLPELDGVQSAELLADLQYAAQSDAQRVLRAIELDAYETQLRKEMLAKAEAAAESIEQDIRKRDAELQAEMAQIAAERAVIRAEHAVKLEAYQRDVAAARERVDAIKATGAGDDAPELVEATRALDTLLEAPVDPRAPCPDTLEIVYDVEKMCKMIDDSIRISEGFKAANSPVTGDGTAVFTTGVAAHIVVEAKDDFSELMDYLIPLHVYAVASPLPGYSKRRMDAAVSVSVAASAPGVFEVTYVVHDETIKNLVMHVEVCGVPVEGSPFALKHVEHVPPPPAAASE
jgi:hypothetical protein